MPNDGGYVYLVEARCDLTGYVVARPIKRADTATIKRFFVEDILFTYGLPLAVTVDGGLENKGEFRSTI